MRSKRPLYPPDALGLKKVGEPLRELIDVVFFASLGKEEGAPTRVRVAYHENCLQTLRSVLDPIAVGGGTGQREAWEVFAIQPSIGVTEFTVDTLRKIASATDFPRGVVAVGREQGRLLIKGVAYRMEYGDYDPVGEADVVFLHSSKPGHLTFTMGHRTGYYEDGRWTRRTSLEDLVESERSIVRAALATMSATLIDSLPQGPWADRRIVFRVVRELVEGMAMARHGGLMLFSPTAYGTAGKYCLDPGDQDRLTHRVKGYARALSASSEWFFKETGTQEEKEAYDEAQQDKGTEEGALNALIKGIARLTLIDNAVLLGTDLRVFGAGYTVRIGKRPRVWDAKDVEGHPGAQYPLDQHGSRHRAAASFAAATPGGVAFLASQDGALRCFHRPREQKRTLVWHLRVREG